MTLEEMKADVLAKANEVEILRNERDSIKESICDVIKKNINEILVPYLNSMNNFITVIRDKANTNPSCNQFRIDLPLGDDVDEYYNLRLIVNYCYGVNIEFSWSGSYSWYEYLNGKTNSSYSYSHHHNLRKYFINEEETQKVVDMAQKEYINAFGVWAEHLENRNKELSKSIECLREELAKTHSVEHKEDGSVEIHLGGKTYTATLKEE